MAKIYTIKREKASVACLMYTRIESESGKLLLLTTRGHGRTMRVAIAGRGLPCGVSIERDAAAEILRTARRKA